MKKKTLIIAAVLVCLMLGGCGSTTSEISSDKDSLPTASESDSSTDESSVEFVDISSDETSTDEASVDNSSSDVSAPDEITDPDEQTKVVVPTNYGYEYFDNDLFIGDSIFTGLSLYGILNERNVAASVGNSIYGAHYNTLSSYNGTAVDYAEEMQPAHINIMLGSNMLGPGVSLTGFVNDYKSLINALETACPNSGICIISVPPITADSSLAESAGITKATIDSANDYIKEMCEELEIRYFDLNFALSDKNGYFMEEYAEVDGFHFKKSAYDVLLFGLETQWN